MIYSVYFYLLECIDCDGCNLESRGENGKRLQWQSLMAFKVMTSQNCFLVYVQKIAIAHWKLLTNMLKTRARYGKQLREKSESEEHLSMTLFFFDCCTDILLCQLLGLC